MADMSDEQLEKESFDCKMLREQQLLSGNTGSGTVNTIEGAIGPTLMLELNVEDVGLAAVVDTASNSTIMSRSMLHEIKDHLQSRGKSMPPLERPCVPLYGKEGTKGKPLNITAQVTLTYSCEGRSVTVPTFIQFDSKQKCLIGMNVIPFLDITVRRSNGKPLHAIVEREAQVRLIQSITIPSRKGRVVEVQVDGENHHGNHFLFQPEHKLMDDLGMWSQVSSITVQPSGKALIPVQNFQGISVTLEGGVQLGVVNLCNWSHDVDSLTNEPSRTSDVQCKSTCASVTMLRNTPERYKELMKELKLPNGMSACEADQFQQRSTDVFALNDDELGCTNIVSHRIDTGEHPPVKQPPYRSPMVYRDQITQMVTDMQEKGIVQPSTSPWASPVFLMPKKDR